MVRREVSKPLFLLPAGLLGLLVFAWFVRLERNGKRMTIVLFILGLLVVESVIYPNPNFVPAGLFHPGGGSDPTGGGISSFRLPDLLVPLAFAARVYAGGRTARFSTAALWWLAFLTWLAAAAVMGLERGNAFHYVSYEGKAIIYLGFFLLVAGIPAAAFAHGEAFRRFLYGASALALFNVVLEQLNLRIAVNLPGLPIQDMGSVGADAATIFLALGLFAAAMAACREEHRLSLFLAAVPLMFATVVAQQRAAVVALAVSLPVLVALLAVQWRRVRTTPTELALTALAALALVLVPVLGTGIAGKREPVAALVASVDASLTSRSKQLSAEDRLIQWTAARRVIRQHVITGSGLGTTYQHFDPGPQQFITTDITHNIALDLLMRSGVIGLALFVVALALTAVDGVRVWLRHHDSMVAAVSLAATAGLLGLVGKGMVESIFEKFRLAVLFGFLIGAVASGLFALTEPAAAEAPGRRPLLPVRPAWR